MTECPNCGFQAQSGDAECSKCGTDFTYIKAKLEKEKTEATEKQKEKKQIVAKLIDLIKPMDLSQLKSLLEHAEKLHGIKKRMHDRISCWIATDCVHKGRAFNKYIKEISLTGAFLETDEPFPEGDEITLTLAMSPHVKPFKVTGEIVRKAPGGVGLKFKLVSQVQEELIENLVKTVIKLKK